MTKANMLGQYVFRIVISLYERKIKKKIKKSIQTYNEKDANPLGGKWQFSFSAIDIYPSEL